MFRDYNFKKKQNKIIAPTGYTVHLRYVSFCCATGTFPQSKQSRRALAKPSGWFGSSTRQRFFTASRRKPMNKYNNFSGVIIAEAAYENWKRYLWSSQCAAINTQMLSWRFKNDPGLCTVVPQGGYVLPSQPNPTTTTTLTLKPFAWPLVSKTF